MLSTNKFKGLKSFIYSIEEPMVLASWGWVQSEVDSYAFFAIEYTPTELWIGLRMRTSSDTPPQQSKGVRESLDIFLCLIPCLRFRLHFHDTLMQGVPVDLEEP